MNNEDFVWITIVIAAILALAFAGKECNGNIEQPRTARYAACLKTGTPDQCKEALR